jgi:hypothetical protein
VTGVNPRSGFSTTAGNRVARCCPVGTSMGLDTIAATVSPFNPSPTRLGTASSSACDVNNDGKVDLADLRPCQLRLTSP